MAFRKTLTNVVRAFRSPDVIKREKEREDDIRRQLLLVAQTYQLDPQELNDMAKAQGIKMNLPTERVTGTVGVSGQEPPLLGQKAGVGSYSAPTQLNIKEPIRFQQKSNPNELVKINDEATAKATGLPIGTYTERWKAERLFAPQTRAEIIAGGQVKRQQAGQSFQEKQAEKKELDKSIDALLDEVEKTKTFSSERMEDINTRGAKYGVSVRPKTEESTPGMFEGLADIILGPVYDYKPSKKVTGISIIRGKQTTPTKPIKGGITEQDTATRKRNPSTGKWHIFKDGSWQEE